MMAEPLLRRTLSRLRRKEKRKSELRVNVTSSSSSVTNELPPPGTLLTVAKIQTVSLAPPPPQSSTHTPQVTPPLINQHVSGHHQLQSSNPAGGASLSSSSSFSSSFPPSYLQSLYPSSRSWLLSSAHSVAGAAVGEEEEEQQTNFGQQGGANAAAGIWYNPIPEEEQEEEEEPVWRRREEQGAESIQDSPQSTNSDLSYHGDEIPAESSGCRAVSQKDEVGVSQKDKVGVSQKDKVGVSQSVIDRLRSPGSVRKLSLKMKKLPELRRKLSLRSAPSLQRYGNQESTDQSALKTTPCQNVLSRYHLDSAAPPGRPLRCPSIKRGYLSDGDSPELFPRQQRSAPPAADSGCDITSFRLYVNSDWSPCSSQRVSGVLAVHLMGLEDLKSCEDHRDVLLAIQVDGVTFARTGLLPLTGSALSLNHTFHLQLDMAHKLRLLILTPAVRSSSGGQSRNRLCAFGRVTIAMLFTGSRSPHQLCVKLEPRGLLYLKVSLQERHHTVTGTHTLQSCALATPHSVFGAELGLLVAREGSACQVPLLIQKCVCEIERRGLKVVGVYRLCGSAAVKKELRERFDRNCSAVCLSELQYPDINVVTGILKDFLRELPSPLITNSLYQEVLNSITLHPVPPSFPPAELSERTVILLNCLPSPEKATLSFLLDHLSLVASFSATNRMTHQNLAVCFGPVLLTPSQDVWRGGGGGGGTRHRKDANVSTSSVDFKQHIEALHYLLQLWPVPARRPPLYESIRQEVVSRRGRGAPIRLDSPAPINRYAGDWSVCGWGLPGGGAFCRSDWRGSQQEEEGGAGGGGGGGGASLYQEEFLDFDAPFNCRLSLKDFDSLINDLDRELFNICL